MTSRNKIILGIGSVVLCILYVLDSFPNKLEQAVASGRRVSEIEKVLLWDGGDHPAISFITPRDVAVFSDALAASSLIHPNHLSSDANYTVVVYMKDGGVLRFSIGEVPPLGVVVVYYSGECRISEKLYRLLEEAKSEPHKPTKAR